MKKIFKSIIPIEVHHERGIDIIQIEGKVTDIKNGRVYCKGLFYEFSISEKDFEKHNCK